MSPRLQLLLLLLVGWMNRRQQTAIAYLQAENRVLREQLGGRRIRLTAPQRCRLARAGHQVGRRLLAEVATIVTPDTILRWYRELVARKYDGHARRSPGRPRKSADVEALVVQVAQENPTFGYSRIRDVLANLGTEIGRSTVAAILHRNGLEPAPERRRKTTWKQFLAAHAEVLAAADFFTVEVLTWAGLVRYQVFFVLHLATRRVEIAGIVRDTEATGAWMLQIARNLTDYENGFLLGIRYLILDRDPLYTKAFRDLLRASGVKPLLLPRRSPNLNAYAERWVLSVRQDLLNRVVPLGEGHLRRLLRAYLVHYHRERNHQGLGSRLIEPDETAGRAEGSIRCRERAGGLLRYYYRAAA